jgi:hypothetical protein
VAGGYCGKHYQRIWKHGDSAKVLIVRDGTRTCTVDDCGERHYARGFCQLHYWRHYQGRELVGPRKKAPISRPTKPPVC